MIAVYQQNETFHQQFFLQDIAYKVVAANSLVEFGWKKSFDTGGQLWCATVNV